MCKSCTAAISRVHQLIHACSLTGRVYRDLSSNFLSGPVPNTLSLLTGLRVLRLDRNSFTGLVPTSLGSLSRLEFLYAAAIHLYMGL